MKSAISGTVN